MESLNLTGAVDLQAAKSDDKRPTFSINAYNGGLIRVPGHFYPVVIDLAGLKASRGNIPILLNHDSSRIVGQSTNVNIGESAVTLSGVVTDDGPDGQSVTSNAKNGFQWQASVGVDIGRREFIEAGKSVEVNGQTLKGPATVVRAGELIETSFVAIGADRSTSAAVAASKGGAMPDQQFDTVEELRASLAAEAKRAGEIHRIVAQYGVKAATLADGERVDDLAVHAIEVGMDPRDVELYALRASRPNKTPDGMRPNGADGLKGLQCGLLTAAGVDSEALAKEYGPEVVEACQRGRLTLLAAARRCLELSGIWHDGMSDSEIIKASSTSTYSLPSLLSQTVQRSLAMAYRDVPSTWQAFADIVSVSDFRPTTRLRPHWFLELEPIGKDGEIQHGEVGEESYPLQIGSYARMFAVARQDIINDDLGFLSDLPREMAAAARRTLDNLIYRVILANDGSFFSAGNSNLLTTGSALSATSLGEAIELLRKREDAAGNSIALVPKTLVVPPELELTAKQLLNSVEINAAAGLGTANVFHNAVALAVEPRLSNTSLHANASATQWYLFANPSDAAVSVGFLQGKRTPTVETQEADFNTLGIQHRVYHDFGVALGDPKAVVKATGAAE